MKKNEPAKLIGFVLPAVELIPGFLVPVYDVSGTKSKQVSKGDERILALEPISESNFLDIETLRLMLNQPLIITKNEVTEGGAVCHAFFDGKTVYLGDKKILLTMFNSLAPRIVQALSEVPYSLAGLYDFMGRGSSAKEIRRRAAEDDNNGVELMVNKSINHLVMVKNNSTLIRTDDTDQSWKSEALDFAKRTKKFRQIYESNFCAGNLYG
jgi:hypothetical protein